MLAQAGAACVCRSAAWDAKIVTSAWWAHADQVRLWPPQPGAGASQLCPAGGPAMLPSAGKGCPLPREMRCSGRVLGPCVQLPRCISAAPGKA